MKLRRFGASGKSLRQKPSWTHQPQVLIPFPAQESTK